ncbi:MAG: hypothetical protein R3F61_31340 [Myxococcota bacterium]
MSEGDDAKRASSSPVPLDLDDTMPERPPSSSYAPTSLTPFRPLEVPELPDESPSAGANVRRLGGAVLGVLLVAALLAGLLVMAASG